MLDHAQESASLLPLHSADGALNNTMYPVVKAKDALVECILFRFMRTAAHKWIIVVSVINGTPHGCVDFINHWMRCLSEFYLQNQFQSAWLKTWVKQKDVSSGGRYQGLCSSQDLVRFYVSCYQ